ncbi:MAG: hypothetical protein PHF89_02145 [Eubacteriales bacterium]|nr:hypothetical protein [Eubacteriales bacterium]
MKRLGIVLGLVILLNVFSAGAFAKVQAESDVYSACPKEYIKVAPTEKRIWDALDVLQGTVGEFSRNAILGENLSAKPIKVEFLNLATINPLYADYDALGIKKGKQLYIYINQKHYDAPKEALAALLSHEALHQDEYNSLNEETYAWTMEAKVWHDLVSKNPAIKNKTYSSLVRRENILSKMLENANFSNTLIKNTVVTHPGYQKLPMRSPGFD